MKALSLTRPWPWIIEHLGKRIENRSWTTDYRGPVLLHASKTMRQSDWYAAHDFVYQRRGQEAAASIPKPKDPRLVQSAIVLVAELVDIIWPGWKMPRGFAADAAWLKDQKRWYMGEYGWVLRYVAPTNITPCAGMMKLWQPSPDLINRALEGVKWPGKLSDAHHCWRNDNGKNRVD